MRASKQKIALLSVVCGAVWSLASVETAQAQQLGVELGTGRHRVQDESFMAVERTMRHPGISLGLSYALESISPDLEALLWMQSGGQPDGGTSSFDNRVVLDWRVQRVMVGGDWGKTYFGVLRPSVRAGVGYSHQRLDYRSVSGPTLTDHAHDVAGFGAIGARLTVPLGEADELGRQRASIGVQFYTGYMAQSAASFDELRTPRAQRDEEMWTYEPVSLGDVSTSGIFWNIAVTARFGL